MRVLVFGLTLFASTLSFANTVDGIENKLNQEVCGNNLPSMSKAFELPETYRTNPFNKMTKFQQSTQKTLAAISDVQKLEIDAFFTEGNTQKAEIAKASREALNSYAESMLREVKLENRYNGLVGLCSYLNR